MNSQRTFLSHNELQQKVDRNYQATVVFGTSPGNWSAGGSWIGGSAPGTGDTAQFNATSGNCTLDAPQTVAAVDFTGGGISNYTSIFTHNAFVLTVAGNVGFVSGMTYTPLATATIAFSQSGTLLTGTNLMPSITVAGSKTLTLGDNCTTMASKVITLTLTGALNLGGFTLSGNSTTNRLLIQSNGAGTSRTVTIAAGTFANADFMDISFSNGGNNLDLSAITGNSGDCGGNSNATGGKTVTFTTSAQQTCTMSSNQNWSTAGIWTSRVPLPQDDVVMTGVTGGTLAADMPRLGRSISCTGFSGGGKLNLTSIPNTIYGSLTLITSILNINQVFTFAGRGSYTITNAGNSLGGITVTFSAPNGTYTLQDSMSNIGGAISITSGTFNDNGFNLTMNSFNSSNSNTRTIIKSGIWNITGTSGNSWNIGISSGLTFSDTGSIVFVNASTSSRTFQGGGLSYGTLTYTVAGSTGTLVIIGSNTFNTINFSDGSNARTLQFTAGTTTNIGIFNVNGLSTKLITVESTTNAIHTLNFTRSSIQCQYLDLIYSKATGAAADAGNTSTDGGNNSGWTFNNAPSSPPSSDSGMMMGI